MLPRSARLVIVAASVAAAGCGRSSERDHYVTIRSLCAELAAAGATPAEAEVVLGGPPQLRLCRDDLAPLGDGDGCTYGPDLVLCDLTWAWRARNEALCGGPGCSYGCQLRVADEEAPACLVLFRSGSGELVLP